MAPCHAQAAFMGVVAPMRLEGRHATLVVLALLVSACGSAPTANPSPAASPAVTAPAQGSALGQPVMTVAEALAWHAAHPSAAGSIIVRGWYGEGMSACGPYRGAIDGLEWDCPFAGLMAQPERLVTHSGNTTTGHGPTGPYLALRDIGGVGWPPAAQGVDAAGQPVPPEVTAIGHFNEPRSVLCQESQRQACRDAFVVDGYLGADGLPIPFVVRGTQAPGRQSPDDVRAAAGAGRPGLTALATTITNDGSDPAQADTGADPRLLFTTWPGSGQLGWLVRLVSLGGDAPPVTVFVDDVDLSVHELPAWPTWIVPPTKGLDGTDPVAVSSAAQAACAEGAPLSGGVFFRARRGADLYRVNTYYHGRQRVLADPAAPPFVRGTGFDTIVLDASGTPLGQGTVAWLTGCTEQNNPDAPFVFRKVGM